MAAEVTRLVTGSALPAETAATVCFYCQRRLQKCAGNGRWVTDAGPGDLVVALSINAQSDMAYKQKHHHHLRVGSAAKQQKTGAQR